MIQDTDTDSSAGTIVQKGSSEETTRTTQRSFRRNKHNAKDFAMDPKDFIGETLDT